MVLKTVEKEKSEMPVILTSWLCFQRLTDFLGVSWRSCTMLFCICMSNEALANNIVVYTKVKVLG